jgi:anti-sigma regulatory factor (Ser/Thr protein kinase)/CheY-like chemotaxis protein
MTAPKPDGGAPPTARREEVADRRREIVADIRHDLKNAHLAAAAALRRLGELVNDDGSRAALIGLGAAVDEVRVHSERGLELLSLGIDEVEPATEPLALEPILREVDMARRAAAEQAGIDLQTPWSGAVAAVDRRLLARCVGNLVTNAIEHSGASRVLLGVRRHGSGCVIEVRDNGRGIDAAAVRGMEGQRWAEGSGRGLGLWIASRFARLLGGELDVRSQAGRGTCFRVTLPGPVSWAPGSQRAARPSRLRLDGRIVVLLEDDAAQLQATRLAFERRGAKVVAARSQVEFWSEIEQLPRPPDLCVLDFILGRAGPWRADGARLTSANDIAWLKKRFGNQTKVVLLTANPGVPQLAAIGDVPIFQKPLQDATIDAMGADLLLPRTPTS